MALGLAAAIGFTNQSSVIETAEDAVDAITETQAVYDGVLAIGNERLLQAGGEVGDATEIRAATDAALDLVEAAGSPTTISALPGIRSQIADSRQASESDAVLMLGAAAFDLFHLDVDAALDYPSSQARNTSISNRMASDSLLLREWAWIAYLDATEVSEANIGPLTADFVTSHHALEASRALDMGSGGDLLTSVLELDNSAKLHDLETIAVDDMAEGNITVSEAQVMPMLVQFRADMTEMLTAQGDSLEALVESDLRSANDLRSLFVLLAALAVVVLLGLIFVIYRSITNPLESLLGRASSVANEELPALVDALRHDAGSEELPVAQIIPVDSDDEIGELVNAFNDVQITAYDLATEQALSRRNVADMFVNLGRRNQQLLQRILAQLTSLEQEEEDPDKLRELFELDNVVTRMRRNAESLLALAGAQTARQWSQPISIDNTVRAAFGEVEGYERIDVAELADVKVVGSVVSDITHLLAELLENAINFSEPTTSVVVNGRTDTEGYVVTVVDQGIGMSQRELSEGNSRITDPPPLDQVPTRFLGLYVVGRLAERHGIEVVLSETTSGGIAAKVLIPHELLVTADDEAKRSSSPAQIVETETSPLEEDHDLDAELASITSGEGIGFSDSDDDGSFDDSDEADDDGDSGPDGDGSIDEQSNGGLPTRSRKGHKNKNKGSTAVAEAERPVETVAVADKIESDTDLDTDSELETVDEATEEVVEETVEEADDDVVEEASDESTEEEVDEPVAQPEADASVANDLGLPVRNKGGALDQAAVTIDRSSVLDREATDASPEAAGSFSSMMSALTSGVARGLEESEQDESTEGHENE